MEMITIYDGKIKDNDSQGTWCPDCFGPLEEEGEKFFCPRCGGWVYEKTEETEEKEK